jgi:RNA polymerase sigma-70 factor (ECF subfamily)
VSQWIEEVVRSEAARIVGRLAVRFRDLDLAEEAFAEAVSRAVSRSEPPDSPAGWLAQVAERAAIDAWRRRRRAPPLPAHEDEGSGGDEDRQLIPDDRLRLFFIASHPALAVESRAALILRLLTALPVETIAGAFLVSTDAMRQRLTRAKARIAATGIPFTLPAPSAWPERVEAILVALDVAHASANADAALASPETSGLRQTVLDLTELLASLLPEEGEVAAQAAAVRLSEARRPARIDAAGAFVPLSEQDPSHWNRQQIVEALPYLRRAVRMAPQAPRTYQARLQAIWCGRRSLAEPPPWAAVRTLYDEMLTICDDPIIRINRCVALAETEGPQAALAELEALDPRNLGDFAPYHAVLADCLARVGRVSEALPAYDRAIALASGAAERRFLDGRRRHLLDGRIERANGKPRVRGAPDRG